MTRVASRLVELSGVSKAYGRVRALSGVDLRIEPGATALVGANGAGKTTLLKIVLGLATPDSGRASVLGHAVPGASQAVRARLGYVPEGACLPSDVTAAEFVAFMAQLGGVPPRQARERASELLYGVGLGEERYRSIGGFSTGMKQRVKLAQALVHDPDLLLLDEPTDGMDPRGRADMLDLVERIRGELGVDILLSTHLLGDVERVCDHVVMLHAGRVVADLAVGEMAERAHPTFEVELGDNGHAVQAALEASGLRAAADPNGRLLVSGASGPVTDVIRDLAADRGWPLYRLAPRALSLEEALVSRQRSAQEQRPEVAA
jgi:ABC-2 type transport system ATP-binding protein